MIEDIIKIGIALIVIICAYFSSRWILKAVYTSAGVSKEELFSYRGSVSQRKHPGRYLSRWIMNRSSDPAKTRKYLRLYTLATAGGAFFAAVTLVAIIVDSEVILKLHIITGIVLLLFYTVLFFSGRRYRPLNGDIGSLKKDARDYIDFVKRNTDPKEERGTKSLFFGILQLAAIVGLMGLFVVSVTRCHNAPMEATEYSIVWNSAVEYGCGPIEALENYRDRWNDDAEDPKLLKALVAGNNDISIEYFEFCEDTYAKNVASQSIESYREKEEYDKDKEILDSRGNFNIYVYSDGETVTRIYRVDKTLLFVRYSKDNKTVSDEFLKDIGYKDK